MYSSTTKQKIEIISKRLESDILQTMAGGKASLSSPKKNKEKRACIVLRAAGKTNSGAQDIVLNQYSSQNPVERN